MSSEYEIPVVYQDEHIIVVNKPVDLPVHKNDFMPHDAPYLTKLLGEMTNKWVYNVHRLDSKTSGLILLAFSSEIAKVLTQLFEKREVRKTYSAVVQGIPGEGTFNRKVVVKKKSKFKKDAITNFSTLKSVNTQLEHKNSENLLLSLVEIEPVTGRWHQIRQHFAQHHFDILGDSHHGDFALNKKINSLTGISRLYLHASKISFMHPVTRQQLEFETQLPEEFSRLFQFFELK